MNAKGMNGSPTTEDGGGPESLDAREGRSPAGLNTTIQSCTGDAGLHPKTVRLTEVGKPRSRRRHSSRLPISANRSHESECPRFQGGAR